MTYAVYIRAEMRRTHFICYIPHEKTIIGSKKNKAKSQKLY